MNKILIDQVHSARPASLPARLRPNLLACGVGLALAQMAGLAWADSAVGQNTTLGNAANPAPVNPAAQQAGPGIDPDANVPPKRSPSGLLYGLQRDDEEPPAEKDKAPTFKASVEAGLQATSGDKNAALFRMYRDPTNSGLVLNNFSFSGETPADAMYVEGVGGSAGRQDQFYGLNFGKYNEWKASVFYNETVHVFTTTAYPLMSGIGTGNLTLPSNLPAAGGATFLGYYQTVTAGTGACGGAVKSVPTTGYTACFSSPLVGGGSAAYNQAAINSAVGKQIASDLAAETGPTTLSLVRKNGGITYDMRLNPTWRFFASATTEHRQGARPFGEIQGGGGGTAPIEIAEPIDYDTHDLRVGLRYVDKLTNFNVMVNANLFRNNISSLTFQNPFLDAAQSYGTLVQQGRFALYPNNDYYNLKAEFARNLPDFYKARFTATVSASTMRQNDQLLPPSVNGGTAGTPGQTDYVNLNLWNTTAALSQQTANARIDTHLVDLGLSLAPRDDLDVRAKLRQYETDNKTTYYACNPQVTSANLIQGLANPAYIDPSSGCAGVWGRLLNDGGGSAIITAISAANGTPNSNNIIRNIPYQSKQTNAGLSADYRLDRVQSFNAALEREYIDRKYRERPTTWEDRLKVGYVNREAGPGTLRLSAEYDRRRGDTYDSASAYYQFLGVALPLYGASTSVTAANYVLKLADLRKFDLSDRDQQIVNLRWNYPFREDLDVGVSGQMRNANYPGASDGRNDQWQSLYNLDFTWTRSTEQVFTGYLTYSESRISQNNVYPGAGTGVACTLGNVINGVPITADNAQVLCGSVANNSTFNPLNAWSEATHDRNLALGLNWEQAIGKMHLSAGYQQTFGHTAVSYGYTPGVGVMPTLAAAAMVGNGTEMKLDTQALDLKLRIPIQKALSATLMLRYEHGSIYDYHYAGLSPANLVMWGALGAGGAPITPVGVLEDTGPQSYHVTSVGAMLQYKF